MLATHPRFVLAPGRMELAQGVWRAPGLIVARTRTRGLPTTEIGGDRPSTTSRGWAWVVLRGEAWVRVRERAHALTAGTLLVAPEAAARFLRTSADVDLLQVVYDAVPGSVPEGGSSGRLDRAERAAWTALSRDLAKGDPTGDGLQAVAGDLPGLGRAPVEAALGMSPAPIDRAIAALVARCASALDRRPGIDDLAAALGLSERRASEAVSRYFRRYHASFGGWRSYVSTLRAELGHHAIGSGRLPSSAIAERLGYGAAPALYHALARRGLGPDR